MRVMHIIACALNLLAVVIPPYHGQIMLLTLVVNLPLAIWFGYRAIRYQKPVSRI